MILRYLLFLVLVLGLAYGLFEWLNAIPSEKRWGVEHSPRRLRELHVYKRPKPMHQAPDIVLYACAPPASRLIPLQIISPTDEDDRSDLRYEVFWTTDSTALFVLSCSNCIALDEWYYRLNIGANPPYAQALPADSVLAPNTEESLFFERDKIMD